MNKSKKAKWTKWDWSAFGLVFLAGFGLVSIVVDLIKLVIWLFS